MTAPEPGSAPPPAPPPLVARYGLVRPRQGRYLAGVCAALGRATRTDPVLWRVVLAVLVCFGGLGVLAYLLVWLLAPEEDDPASPLQSLLGRGYSSTSPVLTGVLGLVVVGLLAVVLPRPLYMILGASLTLAVLLLINRARVADATGPPPPAPPPADQPPPPAAAPVLPTPPPPAWGPAPQPGYAPSAAAPPAGGYRPPFAPYGPYPPAGGQPPPGPYPGAPFAPHGPYARPAPPPPPPRPPRERSQLGAIAFFATVLLLGLLGGLDATGVLAVPAAGYVAAALAVVGTGLVVGAWLGRARVLIALGTVLALALPAAHAVDTWQPPEYVADEFRWAPRTEAQLQDQYEMAFAHGVLDLRQLELAGRDVSVAVRVTFGEAEVIVPPDAAVVADVTVRLAGARVFGERVDDYTRDTITDPGSGEPTAGLIRLDLYVGFGDLEVRR